MSDLIRIDPQPPQGIHYMLGAESWLPENEQTPRRLACEEWGALGHPNSAGFDVRCTDIPAPCADSIVVYLDGVYYWARRGDK